MRDNFIVTVNNKSNNLYNKLKTPVRMWYLTTNKYISIVFKSLTNWNQAAFQLLASGCSLRPRWYPCCLVRSLAPHHSLKDPPHTTPAHRKHCRVSNEPFFRHHQSYIKIHSIFNKGLEKNIYLRRLLALSCTGGLRNSRALVESSTHLMRFLSL